MDLDGLSTNHKETDTRMMLYAKSVKEITRMLLFTRQAQIIST